MIINNWNKWHKNKRFELYLRCRKRKSQNKINFRDEILKGDKIIIEPSVIVREKNEKSCKEIEVEVERIEEEEEHKVEVLYEVEEKDEYEKEDIEGKES